MKNIIKNNTERPTTISYNASIIPTAELEDIIRTIRGLGFGAAGPAMCSTKMYHRIATMYAKRTGKPWPHLARLECTYEKRNSSSVYAVPHCEPADAILHKYFGLYSTGDEDYWYIEPTTIEDIKHWLNDDFIGTMENPIY